MAIAQCQSLMIQLLLQKKSEARLLLQERSNDFRTDNALVEGNFNHVLAQNQQI